MTRLHIAVIGGGFTGASFAIQALRAMQALCAERSLRAERTTQPVAGEIAVTLIEPRAQAGRGIAYSSDDPDHRLNAPSLAHFVRPEDPEGFHRWWLEQVGSERDPAAITPQGLIFPRRSDFGRFMQHELAQCAPQVVHLRARAVALSVRAATDAVAGAGAGLRQFTITLDRGEPVVADRVVIATGMAPVRLPAPLPPAFAELPAVVASPWDLERIRRLARDARVLMIGSGLTAYDLVCTLLANGHRGELVSLSRHGLRPQPLPLFQLPAAGAGPSAQEAATPPPSIWDRLQRPVPAFLELPAGGHRARLLVRRVRAQIAAGIAAGASWYEPFDDLRDALSRVWLQLSLRDQRQLLRHLRPWYDTHRYRLPPQTDARVRQACASGQLQFRSGRIASVRHDGRGFDFVLVSQGAAAHYADSTGNERFDAIVNCTGPSASVDAADLLLASLLRQGLVQPNGNGVGIAVDGHCRLIDRQGRPQQDLLAFGPPTAGSLADPIGAVFISAHIHRVLRDSQPP